MKSGRPFLAVAFAVALTVPALSQQQTVARLSPESHADITRTEIPRSPQPAANFVALRDSAVSRAAADALFATSDLQRARTLADKALRRDAGDAEALFVRMELAALEADDVATLDAAMRLCEAGGYARGDARVRLAAVRVRELAANTPQFRSAIPRLQSLLANSPQAWPDLELALLNAAMDGAPGLDAYAVARSAGILTDWRIVGPIGARPLLDLDRQLISPADDLTQQYYAGRAVENFQFPDGWIRLPDYLQRHGVLYAAGRFASLTAEARQITVESAGALTVFIDGEQVARTDAGLRRDIVRFQAMPGPHRVLLKFAATAAPLRVMMSPAASFTHAPLRARLSPQEAVYLLAAEHYAEGEFATAEKQIAAEPSSDKSLALQFLSRQATSEVGRNSQAKGQHSELSQTVLASDPESWWAQKVAEHPSCDVLVSALAFYQSHGLRAERDATQQKLDGCAPESLAYARSLALDGKHADAAQALRRLLAGAPLNREARLMLIGELQLCGDDEAAQRAAGDWLRLAPNAPEYHRLAVASDAGDAPPSAAIRDFYQPYRRDALPLARRAAAEHSQAASVVLLDDHVAIARPDGSVSLYVHTARQWTSQPAAGSTAFTTIPPNAQVLTLRIIHADGSIAEAEHDASQLVLSLSSGDTLDAEYVLHFTGDGGIPEHAEAFQFTFGSFDEQVLSARFVVLTPADHGDGGVVIATGAPPAARSAVRDGMLERVWEKSTLEDQAPSDRKGLAIVRVVEQENGWSIPSSAEHKKKIETIHPKPLPEDS